MKIKIIDTIDDPFLKFEWERLEREYEIFPQSTYHWCMTWWNYLGGNRRLHVVMAMDDEGKTVAIAPLCIERNFGVYVLRSFPIHFGDFYTFITSNNESSQAGINSILEYMASKRQWRWVQLQHVSEKSSLLKKLVDYNCVKKEMTDCIIADFRGLDWESYLSRLRKSFRADLLRRLRIMHKAYKAELVCVRTWREYEHKFDEMVTIHQERWKDDYSPKKTATELACWKAVIKGQFEAGKMVYYQLFFDSVCVAYDLGFLHGGTYYDWHTSYRPDYRKYNPGIMMQALMIKHFIDNGISRINFMAGEYYYKMHWSPDQRVEKTFMLTSASNNISGLLMNCYHHVLRDRLKVFYHKAMQYGVLRFLSRHVIRLRKRISHIERTVGVVCANVFGKTL